MSTESLSPQTSALLSRVEMIESDAAAMKVAHSRSRLARLVILLMLAVAAVVFVYLFLSLAARFTDSGRQRNFAATALNQFFEVVDVDQRAKAEQAEDWEQLLNQYSDMLVHEMEDLGKTSMPIVQAAFSKQIKQDMPKHRQMFNEQRDLLVSNLQTRGDELLQARYQKILDQHKAILKSEFEDLDDAKMERMLAHLNMAMNRLLKKYYSEEIEGQFNQLKETFDDFAVSDPPGGGETLNQQLLGTSVELLTVKFVGDPIVEEPVGDPSTETLAAASDDAQSNAASDASDDADSDAAAENNDADKGNVALVNAETKVKPAAADADEADAKQGDATDESDQDDAEPEEDADKDEAAGDDAEDQNAAEDQDADADDQQDQASDSDEQAADEDDAEPET